MAGRQAEVRAAIEDPDAVRPSTLRGTCIAYEAFGTSTASAGVRVMVEYADMTFEGGTSRGKVVTAYPPDPRFGSQVGPAKLLR